MLTEDHDQSLGGSGDGTDGVAADSQGTDKSLERRGPAEAEIRGSAALGAVAGPDREVLQVSAGSGRGWSDVKWWLLASGSALFLVLVSIAAVLIVTRKPSTVDHLVILTVPSGAEIKLNATDYGRTPVKLEQLPIGSYTLTITKEGFEPVTEQISVADSEPREYKLKPLPPEESPELSIEERIRQYQGKAEEAFARGHYGMPFEESALHNVLLIQGFDQNNVFAREMLERIRVTLRKEAQAAVGRGDFGRAQDYYEVLKDYFPDDEDSRQAALRLEAQLSTRKGEVRDLVRRAEEALKKNQLIDPYRNSAYYYSKQALAIDRQNAQATAVRERVKDRLVERSDQANERGDIEAAVKQLDVIIQYFPEDRQLRTRRSGLREVIQQRQAEQARANDPNSRRLQGLKRYRDGDYTGAITDLKFAMANDLSSADVVFALARSHQLVGQLDEAAYYFRQIPPTAGESYRSSIAALGDIAAKRGDSATALERYQEARRLGGSGLYLVADLDDKIERIERKQREKEAEPSPVSIPAKHVHGGLFGDRSCSGNLSVSSTSVRFDGSEHPMSWSLLGVSVKVSKDELVLQPKGKAEKFKVVRADGERFREALDRYQKFFAK